MAVPTARQRDPGARGLRWAAARPRAADDEIVTGLYRQYRMPLMSYVLRLTAGDRQQAGLLEEQDRQAFEDHLAGCPSCAAEMAQLSPMAGLLRGIEPVQATDDQPAGSTVTGLLRRRAAAQRRRARWQAGLAAAAGIALIAGGIGIGIATAPSSSGPAGPAVALAGQRHSAADPATGVAGTVGLVAKPWGTQVILDLSKVRGPLECQLVAVSSTGERRVVMGWLVPAGGYGVPGHPGPLLIEGATSITLSNLAQVDIDVVQGRTLLSIPI